MPCCCEVRCTYWSCWQECCCCFASRMSLNKFLAMVPWAPLFALVLFTTASGFTLTGVEMLVESLGVEITTTLTRITQASVGAVIFLNLVFTWSVTSNKMRIAICARRWTIVAHACVGPKE